MKKKVRKLRRGARKTSVAKKKYKSYYIPVAQRKKKTVKAKTPKKKYKSYYKPKKKVAVNPPIPPGTNVVSYKLPSTNQTVAEPVVETQTPKRPAKYLNNKDLLAEVIKSKKQLKMTNELAKMLQLLTMRYGKKGNFANYTYNDDMQSYAMLMICKTWQGFDPAKSSNPFAWFTQCIKNSFIQYLNYEKRQRDIRDEVLVDSGLSPSYNYQYEYAGGEEKPAEPSVEPQTVEHSTESSQNETHYDVSNDDEQDTSTTDMLEY